MAKDGKKRRSAGVTSDINVTPMVDVMLVLLIIFMVITPMLQKGVSVDMAKTDNPVQMPDADKEDALLVAVMKDGTVYFGSDKMPSAAAVTEKLKDKLNSAKAGSEKKVYIKADYRAKYGTVVDVVDNIRAAGVDQVGLMTDQRKTKATPPPATGGLQ